MATTKHRTVKQPLNIDVLGQLRNCRLAIDQTIVTVESALSGGGTHLNSGGTTTYINRGIPGNIGGVGGVGGVVPRKRTMSAATRRKLSLASKKRWAQRPKTLAA